MTHASVPAQVRQAIGLSDALVRLSPGIENARDLVSDLIEGLDGLADHRAALTAGAVSDVS
jgi:cystathionine beta-lyase/cystathionine gamma-synthase